MKWTGWRNKSNRVVNIYEGSVWLIYACLYKYEYYLEMRELYLKRLTIPRAEWGFFPLPVISLYALAMTLYIIPFYRWLAPAMLKRRKYSRLFASVLLYFGFVPKLTNWLVSDIFLQFSPTGAPHDFFGNEHRWYTFVLPRLGGMDLRIILIDIIAFLSIAFMRFALENEQKKYLLEKDNLVLQLESLKAQLHPHFLFNTLNSIYGMSLAGLPETSGYILKLSDMMRFILYDCRHHTVPLEKDIEFLENYTAMEKQRYPMANIQFQVKDIPGTPAGIRPAAAAWVAPLLFIPFVENSFKHGSHRVTDNGSIKGHLTLEKDRIQFVLENDVFSSTKEETRYGGVGIENVRRRLELYYPGQHELTIQNDQHVFKVTLMIHFKPL